MLAAPPGTTAAELLDADPPVVALGQDSEQAAWKAVQHGESSLAVVDADGLFHGLVPSSRLLGLLLRAHDEDFARLGGYLASSHTARVAMEEPVTHRLWHRVPWLVLGLAGAALSAWFVGLFEGRLTADVRLAFFIPGVIYLADAVGTQTEALVVRGLSVGTPLRSTIRLEALTGPLLGLLLAAVGCPPSGRPRRPGLALTVSIALVAACSVATVVAAVLPVLMSRTGPGPGLRQRPARHGHPGPAVPGHLLRRRRPGAGVTDMVQPTLTFLGAAGTVTGSRFLVEGAGTRACWWTPGSTRGCRACGGATGTRSPSTRPIDEVVLTHAHLDHTGYLPRLVRDGFRGPVRCTAETAELAAIVLRDSAHLQEEDARYANGRGSPSTAPRSRCTTRRRGAHAAAVRAGAARRGRDHAGGDRLTLRSGRPHPGVGDRDRSTVDGHRVLFSGDLGRRTTRCSGLRPTRRPADTIVVESTYGDRLHPVPDPQRLADADPAHDRAGRERARAGLRRGPHRAGPAGVAAADRRRRDTRASRSTWTARWRWPRCGSTSGRSRRAAASCGPTDPD